MKFEYWKRLSTWMMGGEYATAKSQAWNTAVGRLPLSITNFVIAIWLTHFDDVTGASVGLMNAGRVLAVTTWGVIPSNGVKTAVGNLMGVMDHLLPSKGHLSGVHNFFADYQALVPYEAAADQDFTLAWSIKTSENTKGKLRACLEKHGVESSHAIFAELARLGRTPPTDAGSDGAAVASGIELAPMGADDSSGSQTASDISSLGEGGDKLTVVVDDDTDDLSVPVDLQERAARAIVMTFLERYHVPKELRGAYAAVLAVGDYYRAQNDIKTYWFDKHIEADLGASSCCAAGADVDIAAFSNDLAGDTSVRNSVKAYQARFNEQFWTSIWVALILYGMNLALLPFIPAILHSLRQQEDVVETVSDFLRVVMVFASLPYFLYQHYRAVIQQVKADKHVATKWANCLHTLLIAGIAVYARLLGGGVSPTWYAIAMSAGAWAELLFYLVYCHCVKNYFRLYGLSGPTFRHFGWHVWDFSKRAFGFMLSRLASNVRDKSVHVLAGSVQNFTLMTAVQITTQVMFLLFDALSPFMTVMRTALSHEVKSRGKRKAITLGNKIATVAAGFSLMLSFVTFVLLSRVVVSFFVENVDEKISGDAPDTSPIAERSTVASIAKELAWFAGVSTFFNVHNAVLDAGFNALNKPLGTSVLQITGSVAVIAAAVYIYGQDDPMAMQTLFKAQAEITTVVGVLLTGLWCAGLSRCCCKTASTASRRGAAAGLAKLGIAAGDTDAKQDGSIMAAPLLGS